METRAFSFLGQKIKRSGRARWTERRPAAAAAAPLTCWSAEPSEAGAEPARDGTLTSRMHPPPVLRDPRLWSREELGLGSERTRLSFSARPLGGLKGATLRESPDLLWVPPALAPPNKIWLAF